jgi:hypothetical protein
VSSSVFKNTRIKTAKAATELPCNSLKNKKIKAIPSLKKVSGYTIVFPIIA